MNDEQLFLPVQHDRVATDKRLRDAAFTFPPPWPDWIAPYVEHDPSGIGETAFGLSYLDWIEFDDWRHTPAGGEIANLFIRLSLQMKRRGWAHYGAMEVVGAIRWEHALKHGPDAGKDGNNGDRPGPDPFKVNHNWRKRLAIWAMIRHKDLKGFFRLRDSHTR